MAKIFLRKFSTLDTDVSAHNNEYVEAILERERDYFDNILKTIDLNIKLDDEQRRAVITDDDHCLLVAGAGAGKTTTMAAKVKYLVEKKGVLPEEIIVISYTNKAIGELKDRINNSLKIPAKICTFHSFAFEIVKQFTAEPPEVNFSSYQIVFDMLEKAVFNNKPLMRNLVLFMGYYFDLTEDVFKFDSLEQYHMIKAAQDYETLKSGLGEYINKVQNQRSRQVKTITGEYLRSVQEVQIANFLYLNGLDYQYERIYHYDISGSKKKYTPDFYITQGEHSVYLEHYSLSESGYSNLLTPQQIAKYKKEIKDKRELHKRFKTTLLETWSLYSDRRVLIEHLKELLEKEGFILKPRNYDEVYKKIVETGKDKYIIQDIARQRFNLTKRLSEITRAKVVAVGDDWQSIYAFAGSDISLFTRFIDLMGSGTELKITHTYRNSQELIDIAGGFIQKNSEQIRKKLISPKHLENPVVIEPFDDSIKPMVALSNVIVEIIRKLLSEYGDKSSILLLGRYNYDMYKLFNTGQFEQMPGIRVRCKKYSSANISFMTAHSAKGLGYDNVVLINMFEGKFGFPCQIEDDPIIKLVTYEDKSMPFAEERRLFYVALTRTKNRVYIASPKNKPSRFLVELIKDFKLPYPSDMNMQTVDLFNLRCPVCNFPLKYEFNKNYGLPLYICTNDAEVCDFMTNDKVNRHDIFKCSKCTDGYMIVRKSAKNGQVFYGCTNYYNGDRKCNNMISIRTV